MSLGKEKGVQKFHFPSLLGFLDHDRPWDSITPSQTTTPLILRNTKGGRFLILWNIGVKDLQEKKDTLHQVNFHNYRKLHLFLTPRKL